MPCHAVVPRSACLLCLLSSEGVPRTRDDDPLCMFLVNLLFGLFIFVLDGQLTMTRNGPFFVFRIPDADLPGDARLSVVEVLLYGWVSTAIRLEGGKHRWLVHGIAGYLLTKFAAELRGEEEKQHRLWCAVQKAVSSTWLGLMQSNMCHCCT